MSSSKLPIPQILNPTFYEIHHPHTEMGLMPQAQIPRALDIKPNFT